jgi:hypothetical protein
MAKFIVETAQVIRRKYYVEVRDPTWALDGVVMEELEEFSSNALMEDTLSVREVEEFPYAEETDNVNGATMVFNYDKHEWDLKVRHDLTNKPESV